MNKEQELREQLLKEISADRVVIIDALTGDNRTGYIAPVNALILAEKIHTIYQSNSYYQLQADSEGLVEIINPCRICEYNCPQEKKETCVMYQYYTIKILALKAQKALCDAEKAEAVKKVFDWFMNKSYIEDGDIIEINFSENDLKEFKQTLEESK